jgi:Patatin-like phospholipase
LLGSTADFEQHVLPSEHASINRRRARLGRAPIRIIGEPSETEEVAPVYDTVGLALSGGGIRATAISLGVLQALNKFGAINEVDYLSTVSGGGYIGASLIATMTATGGQFVFVDEVTSPQITRSATAHLRNYSNYLLAGRRHGVASAVAIAARGLVANLAIVMPFMLLLSVIFIWTLGPPRQFPLPVLGLSTFAITGMLMLSGIVLFLLWAIYLSFLPARTLSDDTRKLPAMGALYLTVVGIVFFWEFQPFLLNAMLEAETSGSGTGPFLSYVVDAIYQFALVGLPVGIMVALYQRRLGVLLKRADATSNLSVIFLAMSGRIAIWMTAAETIVLFWLVFLTLTFWGIKESLPTMHYVPSWISTPTQVLFGSDGTRNPIMMFYLFVGGVLLLIAVLLKPNSLTLLGFYRERLRKAFLFDPTAPSDHEYSPLSRMGVSDISSEYAPFYLINVALNIRGSSYANQRGRNADFFSFSPTFAGSMVTGYVPMTAFEKAQHEFDLATAMAISGAAVSSSMGANTIRLLAPTLALLNIRLGYWVRNPRRLYQSDSSFRRLGHSISRSTFSLWSEMTGQVYADTSGEVYLTDGGHIENLGLYELLRRRCALIICVDAEADPEMRLNSFMTLQRYASIDLGIQITLPWQALQERTVKLMGYDPLSSRPSALPSSGPHAAIGIIRYPGGKTGTLLYIKSSLTGDEPDYIADYARRYASFPHESTGNQFFNEEQFEVYRALGFHMGDGVFSGRDRVEILEGVNRPPLFGGSI